MNWHYITFSENPSKDAQNEPAVPNKFDCSKSKNGEKVEIKKSKPVSQRNDIKTYAAAYEEFEYEVIINYYYRLVNYGLLLIYYGLLLIYY